MSPDAMNGRIGVTKMVTWCQFLSVSGELYWLRPYRDIDVI